MWSTAFIFRVDCLGLDQRTLELITSEIFRPPSMLVIFSRPVYLTTQRFVVIFPCLFLLTERGQNQTCIIQRPQGIGVKLSRRLRTAFYGFQERLVSLHILPIVSETPGDIGLRPKCVGMIRSDG